MATKKYVVNKQGGGGEQTLIYSTNSVCSLAHSFLTTLSQACHKILFALLFSFTFYNLPAHNLTIFWRALLCCIAAMTAPTITIIIHLFYPGE